MREPVDIDEKEYREWRTEREEAEKKNPFENIFEPSKARDYVRGSDFRSYLNCARILYWNVHNPLPRRVYLNKSTFGAIRKHEIIQERLEDRGWHGEFEPKRRLPRYDIMGVGHMDALSPTEQFFIELKHNKPVKADELQGAWYQHIHPMDPMPVMVYRNRVNILYDMSSFVNKYIPRVVGVIQHPEILPPKHPSFPKCRGTCDYAPRCGRPRRVRMHDGTPPEWVEFFKAIGAWRG